MPPASNSNSHNVWQWLRRPFERRRLGKEIRRLEGSLKPMAWLCGTPFQGMDPAEAVRRMKKAREAIDEQNQEIAEENRKTREEISKLKAEYLQRFGSRGLPDQD